MNYLSEAFKQLEILNEDVFDLDKDGLEDLRDFQDEDEEEVIDVIDPEAETEEELEDSYIGKVILDCSVCHTDIYKDKEDVIIDEETQLANVGEECPYCFSVDGFKVIGEVKPFVETEFETEDDVDVEVDGEEVEDEEENESLRKNESLKRKRRMVEAISRRNRKSLTEAPVYGLEPRYDSRKSFYGKAQVDTGDKGDKNKLYSYGTLVAEIKNGKPVVYGTYSATTLRHIKDWLKQNGFKAETSKQILADYGIKDESCGRKPRKMKESKLKEDFDRPIATMGLTNWGGIAIYDLNDEEVTYAFVYGDEEPEKETASIEYDCEDEDCRPYFSVEGEKYYLDDFMRTSFFESKHRAKKGKKPLKESMSDAELAREIESAVEWLKENQAGCSTIKLDNRLAVCVGWLDGYDQNDASVIHAKDDPTWAINAGIKVWTSDSMRTDFGWINAPYNEDTGDVWDTDVSISENENYLELAKYFIKEFKAMSEYEINKDGAIVGKWSDDEEFEESCGNRKPRKARKMKSMKESMDVHDLSRDQLIELKQNYMVELADNGEFAEVMGVDYDHPSYGDIADADELISDEDIFRHYDGYTFTEDDFFSSFRESLKNRKSRKIRESALRRKSRKFEEAVSKKNDKRFGAVAFENGKQVDSAFSDREEDIARWIGDNYYFFDTIKVINNLDGKSSEMKVSYKKNDPSFVLKQITSAFKQAGIDYVLNNRFSESLKRKIKKIMESIEDIKIDTGDQEITVSARDKEEVESDGEMIAPLSDEVKTDIEMNAENEENGDEVDVDMDEFSEEEFDDLGESYLKKVYENVNSYKTTSVREKDNKLMVEGLIKFNSGKTKKTSFVFEAKTIDKKGHAKFLGENLQISRGHKSFKLSGTISNNKFIAESLNYNYRAKNGKNSQRIYGTVKVNKK